MMAANYATKKELKGAVGQPLRYTETSIFGPEYRSDGTFCVVGPDAYSRKWFAEVTMENDAIKAVK
jgi:cytochrome c biogenesis protein ResB